MSQYILLNVNKNKAHIDEPLRGNYQLVKFVMNNCLYNVNTQSKVLKYDYFDGITTNSFEAHLNVGFYDGDQLLSHIDSFLTSHTPMNNTYDMKTNKFRFKIINVGETFSFKFSENPQLATILGFEGVDTISDDDFKSEMCADFNPTKIIFMKVYESNDKVFGSDHWSSTCWLTDENSSFGGVFQHTSKDHLQILKFDHTSTVTFKFYDKDYKNLEIDRFSLLLRKI